MGFRVLGFRAQGFRVRALGFTVYGSRGLGFWGLGLRGSGFRGLGFRVMARTEFYYSAQKLSAKRLRYSDWANKPTGASILCGGGRMDEVDLAALQHTPGSLAQLTRSDGVASGE